MKTEVRFLLAVFLMLGVLIGTNRLFPPEVPEALELPADSLAEGRVGELPTSDSAIPDIPGTGADPEIPAGTAAGRVRPEAELASDPAAAVAAPEVQVVVSGPLYRYEFSSIGAKLVSGELSEFPALNRGGSVQLVPDGSACPREDDRRRWPSYTTTRPVISGSRSSTSSTPPATRWTCEDPFREWNGRFW
jgi:hypothetical protein